MVNSSNNDKKAAIEAVMKATGQTADQVIAANPELASDAAGAAARRPPRGGGSSWQGRTPPVSSPSRTTR
jgi:hypothetical protein